MKKIILLLIIVAVFLSGCTNPHTPAGHEGYVKEQPRTWGTGGFQASMIGPKNYGVSIWNNVVDNVDFRPQTYSEKFNILTTDDLNVSFKYNVIIKIKPGTIKEVVEKYAGIDSYKRYIKEPLRSIVRTEVQALESSEVKEKRATISTNTVTSIKSYLKDTPFIVLKGAVGNIDYPEVVTTAVEKKLAAKQLLDEKATQKQIATEDAAIRIEEARGIAEAQRIINTTLTTNYLQHEAFNAQLKMADSPNHTTVYIPSAANGIPLINNLNK